MSPSSTSEALLDAGAVLPDGADVAKDTIDTLTTRAYRHAVLGDRTVVRLVPGTLGQAEDLTMEFLGFTAPETVAEVGVVRQQALGFPAWALVNDPANGHHALALVKDIERLVRVAKSRIGPARDGFVELGERLARSVPHFLPTFYEEAARAFLAADSPTYAASMFGRAREAERLFALQIDETRQHTVFLEFALAGALTAKALSAHSRDLAGRSDAATAYERFRRLCVERTLGGMPPYASMHVDLRRLAKAAKLGQDEEDALLAELLAAPSIVRAPGGFWTAYRPALVRVAKREPRVRGQLLGMIPNDCPVETWLEILEESGAVESLTAPPGSVPAEAESPDGPAGWLARMDNRRGGWRRKRLAVFYELAARMADRLKADGVPVELARRSHHVDLDLVDTVLGLGVPLAELQEHTSCAVDQWMADTAEGRRELTEVAGHDGLLPLLAASVEGFLNGGRKDPADVVAQVIAVPGLRTALHWWLDRLAERIVHQGLTTIDAELTRLALVSCPAGLAVNPEAIRRITEHELGPVLGSTLRAGVFDEFAWPALESAVAEFATATNIERQVLGQWPQLLVRHGDQVRVVGADGVELEHVLRIPADQRRWMWRTILRHVDGQLLVSWDMGQERAAYWSGAADDVFITPDDAFQDSGGQSLALPGGGRTAGGRPLHAGDRSSQERGMVASDGLHYWALVQSPETYQWRWREFDPLSGGLGRESRPAFFEAGAVDGQTLDHYNSRLLPAPASLAGSPLGYRDGLVGWRLRNAADGSQTGEGVDGRTFTLPPLDDPTNRHREGRLAGAIRFPGADTLHGVILHEAYRSNRVTLVTADGMRFADIDVEGRRPSFAGGTPLVPPLAYWHHLRPRDEAGSAVLRAVTDDQARELIATVTALAAVPADKVWVADDAVRELVARTFPQIGDAALVAGVAGIVKHAGYESLRLARLTTATAAIAATPVEVVDPDADKPSDKLLSAALSGLIPSCYDRGRLAVKVFPAFGAALTGGEHPPLAPLANNLDLDWLATVGVLPAIMYRSVSPTVPAEHRTALLDLLEILAASGLLTPGSRIRRLQFISDDRKPKFTVGGVAQIGDRRLVILRVDKSDGEVRALEYAPTGKFGAVPGHALQQEQVYDRHGVDPDQVTAFVALARANGPVAWRPELVRAFSTAAGISLAEATVLLAGLVTKEAWEQGRPADWQVDPTVTDAAIEAAMETVRHEGMSPAGGVYSTLVPADPAAMAGLWTGGPSPDRFAAWRAERVGVRTPVSDDLIVEFRKAGVAENMRASEFLHGVANIETCRWVTDPGAVSSDGLLITVARALPWLVRRLPSGHPIRAALPRLLELTRQRLQDPEFSIAIGHSYQEDLDKFLLGLGDVVKRDGTQIDAGVFFTTETGYWRSIQLRPARVSGPDDPLLAAVLAFTGGAGRSVIAMRAILGDQLANWLGGEVPAEVAGAEHDPARSAPELVAEVAARHGIGTDAATLYLQLLALPDPTDRNVAAWTGWKPARLKAARAELAGTDIVVEAKRPRAGRSLFLPGGWLALGIPHLPLELWKLPLLIGEGENIQALGTIIPVAPAPQLFHLAWARITSGDYPRFEELTTKGRR